MTEEKLSRAERRRRKRGIYPCLGGCGKHINLVGSRMGHCKKCWEEMPPNEKKKYQMLLEELWRLENK